MYFDVKEAQYLDNYKIKLSFEDGSSGVADLSGYPNADNVFHLFLDIAYFRDFRIEHGTLVWGKEELDLAPETLYTLATGKTIKYGAAKSSAM